jgi:hypothetical protein
VHTLCAKCQAAADCWAVTSQELWEQSGGPERWAAKKEKLAAREETLRAKQAKKREKA